MEGGSTGVVNCAAYEGGRRVSDVDLAQACPASTEGSFVWIGLQEPDKTLLRTVQQRFGLHDLAIEDALVAHQRPKLELYGGGVFIALDSVERIEAEPTPRMIEAEVPRTVLAGMGVGVSITPENAGDRVKAEMLVASDGAPLAVRLTSLD